MYLCVAPKGRRHPALRRRLRPHSYYVYNNIKSNKAL